MTHLILAATLLALLLGARAYLEYTQRRY